MFNQVLTRNDIIKSFLFLIMIISIFLMLKTHALSQRIEYKVIGRVVDDKGMPISKAQVILFPKSLYCHTYITTSTDKNGEFKETIETDNKEDIYLYISHTSKNSKSENELISIPFQCVNFLLEKYLGKPMYFGDETIIDVGDIEVQFWFGAVYPQLKIKGKNLTEKQWKKIWIRLIDDQGRLVVEQSIGPSLRDDEVDLEKSLLKLSFPEGKWKLEFQKFDYERNKIYPKILGETPYFVIDKDKQPEIIDVKLKKFR